MVLSIARRRVVEAGVEVVGVEASGAYPLVAVVLEGLQAGPCLVGCRCAVGGVGVDDARGVHENDFLRQI